MSGIQLKWSPDKTVCSMTDTGMIIQTANQAIREMEEKVSKGKQIPMSEFAKILIWEATNLKLINKQKIDKQVKKDISQGWEVVKE